MKKDQSDPLAVERAELLRMIEGLERLTTGLSDANAGVSAEWLEQLQRLRSQVESLRSPTKWRIAWKVAVTIMGDIAAEVIKRLIETSNYLSAAMISRRRLYDDWRLHQIPSHRRWLAAA